MITTLAIYLTTLLLFAGVGLAARALVHFCGVHTGLLVVLPFGAVTSVTLLYLFGYLFTIGRAGIAQLCVVLATFHALAAAQLAVLRGQVAAPRRWRSVEAYIYARRGDVLTIIAGTLVGTLLLLPVFRIGFPTTIAGGRR